MNILLTGASGFVGRNLAAVLGRAGHRIVPASRAQGGDFRQMLDAAAWRPWLAEIDAVINCVGIIGETRQQGFDTLHRAAPTALFQACTTAGIRRVIQISAQGADASAFSAYHLSKRAADDALRALGIDGVILRPGLIYGCGGASHRLFLRLARWPRLPVIGDGRQRLQPVHIGDLAAAVRRCLELPPQARTLDVVGPETLTFGDWLQRLRLAQGLPPAPWLHIPPTLAALAFRLAAPLSPIFRPDNLRMLLTGHHADPAPFSAFLGRRPQDYAPELLFTDALGEKS